MNDENTPWQYKPDAGETAPGSTPPDEVSTAPAPQRPAKFMTWEASEYIEHPHGPDWYFLLIIATVVLAVIVYLLTSHDKMATAIIFVLGIIIGVFAGQKPRVVKYEISDSGLRINDKLYTYNNFKSFAIMREGALSSVNLFPLKRFMPPVSAYFEAADEQKIIDALGNYLPYEQRKIDSIDRLSRRLRL